MAAQDELRELQTRISTARSNKARAEIEVENATTRLVAAKDALEEEFGVKDNAGVKAVMAKLTADRDEALTTVKALLAESGA
jgi:hypothetical protein